MHVLISLPNSFPQEEIDLIAYLLMDTNTGCQWPLARLGGSNRLCVHRTLDFSALHSLGMINLVIYACFSNDSVLYADLCIGISLCWSTTLCPHTHGLYYRALLGGFVQQVK